MFCVFIFQYSDAQDLKSSFDKIYSLDTRIYSGYVYKDNYGPKVKGSPYLYDNFTEGSILVQEKKYENLLLNLDIYNQLLILNFTEPNGGNVKIEVPFFKVSKFAIGEDNFLINTETDSSYQVYQIIKDDNNEFWLRHRKKMEMETVNQQYDFQFTKNFTSVYYVYKPGEYVELKNNKTLLKLVKNDKQAELKKWLRKKRIKVKKTDHKQIKLLSQYLNSL